MIARFSFVLCSLMLSLLSATALAALPGQPVWLDLLTDKPDEAMRFYQQVFGWQYSAGAEPGYSLITSDGHSLGSIMATDAGFQVGESLWLVSLAVDDVDAGVKQVQQLGGKLLDGPAINAEQQRYAVVTDSQGAPFVLLSGSTAESDDEQLRLNEWAWLELWTPDDFGAAEFYSALATYELETVEQASGDTYTVLGLAGAAQLGIVTSPWPDMPANWLPYILVDDVALTIAAAKIAGGRVVVPALADGDNGKVAILVDPTGGAFALQEAVQ